MSTVFLLATFLAAQEMRYFFPDRNVQGWRVYGLQQDCWAKKSFADGTELAFSTDARNRFYLDASNAKWNSIIADEKYKLTITMGDFRSSEVATGNVPENARFARGVSFFFDDPVSAYEAFRSSQAISLQRDSKEIGRYSLSGSTAAATLLDTCTRQIGAADPFAN